MSGKLGDLSRFTSQEAGIHHKQNNRPQGGTFIGTPKTKGSQRSLKLPENVIDVLRDYKAEQNKQKA